MVKTLTRLPKYFLRPLTPSRFGSSVVPFQPYSPCISKTRLTAFLCLIMPQRQILVRNVLPVPDLPKIPFDRSTNFSRSRQTGISSISSGAPIVKYLPPSVSFPKISAMSSSVASPTSEKWVGTVLTGSKPPPAALTRMSIGFRVTVPKVEVPARALRRNASAVESEAGGSASTPGETQSRVTSVIIAKNSCRSPSTTTNLPAVISSTHRAPESFI